MDAPVAAAEPETVSKSEFARLSNVTPGRVSQWLSERKIHGDAIVGEGRDAQIHVARARAQLNLSLDISQRMGNGLSTRLEGPKPIEVASGASGVPPAEQGAGAQVLPFQRPTPSEPPKDPIEEQIKRERLETARRTNRKMAEEEAARNGRYILAEDARREAGKAMVQVISSTEGWCAELASTLSAKFSLPQRDVLHLIRTEYRSFRGTLSVTLRHQAEQLPDMVEDEVPEVEAGDESS